jgi:glycerol-3-phosphate dehydrogenase
MSGSWLNIVPAFQELFLLRPAGLTASTLALWQSHESSLEGGKTEPCDEATAITKLCSCYGLNQNAADHLVSRYGRCAPDVAAYLRQDPALAKPVVPGEPDLEVEFPYQRDHEMALYPSDHLLRRTRLGLFRPELVPARSSKLG